VLLSLETLETLDTLETLETFLRKHDWMRHSLPDLAAYCFLRVSGAHLSQVFDNKHACSSTNSPTEPPNFPFHAIEHLLIFPNKFETMFQAPVQKFWWSSLKRCSSSKVCLSTRANKFLPDDGLTLHDFVSKTSPKNATAAAAAAATPSKPLDVKSDRNLTFHLKTYGCQMNVNDSDIVRSLLLESGLRESADEADANILLTNTCSIREGAEEKVFHRIKELQGRFNKRRKEKKILGVLGCMAERLKEDLFQDGCDLVVGPDAYRDLPRLLLDLTSEDSPVEQAVNVQLSLEETYADITPVRRNTDDVSAFVSIQRGCANRCSFCIVPFTRGQERSRPYQSIVDEVKALHEDGIKEVTLLGQNVNSYHDQSPEAIAAIPHNNYQMSNDGFRSRIRRGGAGYYFADLLDTLSNISPELRLRFTSPHPRDFPQELLTLMKERPNIAKSLHMPAQSGSTSVLKRMKRGYSREAYLELIENVHATIPDVAISSDFISGFCDETEEEHRDTISLMEKVRYDQAFMFAYSVREKTHAHKVMDDNVPEETKLRRLREVIDTFRDHVQKKNEEMELGRLRLVLIEGESKRSKPGSRMWSGRTDQNKRILFPSDDESCSGFHETVLQQVVKAVSVNDLPPISSLVDSFPTTRVDLKPGDYAVVEVTEVKGHGLRGRILCRSSIQEFEESGLSKLGEASKVREAFAITLGASPHNDGRKESRALI